MTEHERLTAQADILEQVAHWCEQPDVPTGAPGLVDSQQLRLRAAALRVMADVLQQAD